MTEALACKKRKPIGRVILQVLVLFFIAGPATLFLSCDGCFNNWEIGVASSIYSGYYWVALWMGNAYGAHWLDRKIDWLQRPLTRLFASVIFTLAYTIVVVASGYYLFFTVYLGLDFLESFLDDLGGFMLWPITITFLISTFMHGRAFFYSWREAAVNIEKLKREQLSSKYESLKKQVNPHFLFNSLNALSSLVHKDPDLSEKFIKKLSEVYRYVLDSQDKEVISLEDELSFARSFIFLQKIRHGESLMVDIDVTEDFLSKQLPPLALQMLLENAIKHNIVSKAKPLEITIRTKSDYLVVENNLQPRKTDEETSGLGINNIKMRYEYLSDKQVSIRQESGKFITEIPLLEIV